MQLEDRFFTSTEVAEILGVSLRSVYRYLEEGKIDAEIKTATGRHRFTRQNILNFLYPDGQQIEEEPSRRSATSPATVMQNSMPVSARVIQPHAPSVAQATSSQHVVAESAPTEPVNNPIQNTVQAAVAVEEEEVDWLSKFRAAAQKHREQMQAEVAKAPVVEPTSTPIPTPAAQVVTPMEPQSEKIHIDSLSSLTEEKSYSSEFVFYYTSGVGGLKELAQYINKAAKKAGVPYAFTMNAGLSLHKLIRPFSVLHIYVKSEDRSFFERTLELSPVDKSSAQLAIFIDRSSVLKSVNEVHGLSVVSNEQLKKDLLNSGEDDLARELNDLS